MIRKTATILAACFALAACASSDPRVIQASPDAPEVHLKVGTATQIEMPKSYHVQSVVVGNPALVTADQADSVVNLVPKEGAGETNLIIRSTDNDGDMKVYQYRLFVAAR